MKTIEEKARAYDKVRKKIAIRFGSNVADEFFAEFAESEDEKIRKALIEYFNEQCDMSDWNGVYGYQVVSWLEKQGEQKPADKVEPKFKVGDKIYLKPEYRMPDDDTPIANTVKEIRRVDDKHYRFDGAYIFIEDQDKYELVEQKPEENKGNIGGISTNWSEEDEENFCSVYLDVKSARQNTVNSLSGELKEQEQKRMDEVISWLKSLKGRVQSKQEWSEEDEQHIDSLLKRLDALCRNKFERTRFAISEDRDWLKSLRPQNKCAYNPYKAVVESIAEMCKHYDKASHSGLRDFYDNVKVKCKDAQEYDKMFPQNTWKPSDEHISLLQAIINEPNNAASESCQIILKDILEQLKKLKEG